MSEGVTGGRLKKVAAGDKRVGEDSSRHGYKSGRAGGAHYYGMRRIHSEGGGRGGRLKPRGWFPFHADLSHPHPPPDCRLSVVRRTWRITGSKTSANGSPAERLSLTSGQIKRDGDAIHFFFLFLFGGPACTRTSTTSRGAAEENRVLGKQTRKEITASRTDAVHPPVHRSEVRSRPPQPLHHTIIFEITFS